MERIIRRNVAVLTALILSISLCWPPTAWAMSTTLQLQTPDTSLSVGQKFPVTVSIAGNPGFCTLQMKLLYDDSVVTCESVDVGEVLDGMLSATNPHATRDGTGAIIAAAGTTASKNNGTVVTYTFTAQKNADPGFRLVDIRLTDQGDEPISYSLQTNSIGASENGNDGKVPNPVPSDPVGGGPSGSNITFSDVPPSHWAADYIHRAAEQGLVSGFEDGTFRPDNSITRAQFVMMLWNMAGSPEVSTQPAFTDVANGSWYSKPLSWAVEQGYVNGTSNTTFSPENNITREQAMAILFRYDGSTSGMEVMLGKVYDDQFSDSVSISSYAKSAVYWAIYNGIVTGMTETTIAPNETASRAQVVAIFLRYMDQSKS